METMRCFFYLAAYAAAYDYWEAAERQERSTISHSLQ